MLRSIGAIARMTVAFVLAAGLLALLFPVASAADRPCRVRNVSQDTTGRSLIRTVERAVDGDRLRVRGTCPGTVVIDVDDGIDALGVRASVRGSGGRVIRVERAATVKLRHLIIEGGGGSMLGPASTTAAH